MTSLEKSFSENNLADDQIALPTSSLTVDQAIIWYGITSILNAFIALLFYLIFNHDAVVSGYYTIMLSHQICYWPVAIGWAAIAIFSGSFTKTLYKAVIAFSVLAPFAGNIIGFIFLWINANNSVYNLWYFWFLWPLYLVYDIGQMLIQFLLLPKIFSKYDIEINLGIEF